MARRTRAGVLALLGTVSVSVGVASLAWACGPSGYGVPDAPPAPPSSTAQPVAPPATADAPPAASAPQAPAASVESGSGTARSVAPQRNRSQAAPPAPTQRGAVGGGRTTAPSPATRADINARIGGSTAGVIQQRGQSVFASSAAPRSATKAKAGKAAARKAATKSTAPAVSQRSATGDLWSGLSSQGASLASAASAGDQSDGLSGGLVAAIALLGLGLAGIAGAALVIGRRRRSGAVAGASKPR